MIIKTVKLTNFRNHSTYCLECQDETSLILGENGSGKTSVLEAIYILTRGKSFRAVDSEIVKRDTDFYRIELEYFTGEKNIATYDKKTKTFSILDQKFKRLPKKHKYPVILFLPQDLNLISHSPSRRRDYFDNIFSQFNEKYLESLSKYNKALKQRNELLKKDSFNKEELFSWNIMLAKYGTDLYNFRQEYINEFNSSLTDIYRSIAKNHDEVVIEYKTELKTSSDQDYIINLEQNHEKDFYLGHTSFGIHHDDYLFHFNQNPASSSASRGETRSIILALKFIEANLIKEKLNKSPLILLDDVFSELDEIRRHALVENFKNYQIIITSAR